MTTPEGRYWVVIHDLDSLTGHLHERLDRITELLNGLGGTPSCGRSAQLGVWEIPTNPIGVDGQASRLRDLLEGDDQVAVYDADPFGDLRRVKVTRNGRDGHVVTARDQTGDEPRDRVNRRWRGSGCTTRGSGD